MSDMYIDVDTAVALVVNKVPLMDDTDFKTRETAIAYDESGMDLVWNFTTSAGVVTQTAVTPTTSGDYDWSHVGDAIFKIEIPASGGGDINNDIEGSGFFSGICDGVLAWVSPIYVFRAAAINNALIDGGDLLDVNMKEVSDDSGAADNLESTYDGSGYADDNAPSTQSQLSGIANVGSAVHRPASSYTLTTGTQSANTYTATEALDETRHEHTDDAGTMELYYEFLIGSGKPSSVQITGYITGNNDDLDIYGYDWVSTSWKQIGNIQGSNSTTDSVHSFDMFVNMVGSGADLGKVRVRLYKTSGLTSALLAIDQIFVAFSEGAGAYNGYIHVNTNLSNTNTVPGVDGIDTNAVSTWAAALTLSAKINIESFKISNGSAITLTGNSDNYSLIGQGYTLALGGQSIASAYIFGATTSGIGTGGDTVFEDCPIGNVTLAPSVMRRCYLFGTITNSGTGDWFINDPRSRVAGSGSPVFDFGVAIGNTNLNIRGNSGGWQLESMGDTGTDTSSIEGWGQIIEGTCTGGTVTVRGNFTISGFTNLTLSDDARIDVDQIEYAVWDAAHSGHNIGGSFGKDVRQTKEGTVSAESTVNDGSATTTSFITNLTEVTDDHYLDVSIVFIDGDLMGQSRTILSYDGTTKTITLDEALTEAPADGVGFIIKTDHVHPVSQIVAGIWGEVFSELAQGQLPTTPTGRQAFMALYMALRNAIDVDSGFKEFNNDAGTVIWKKAVSDDGSNYVEAKSETGP